LLQKVARSKATFGNADNVGDGDDWVIEKRGINQPLGVLGSFA
jgi:hypothetical protein